MACIAILDLSGNKSGATRISHLVQGSWPLLDTLHLSDQGLDVQACSLLGIGKVYRPILQR